MNGGLRVDKVERLNLALCAGAVAASAPLVSAAFAASVAAGALLEVVNFRGLIRAGRSLFAGSPSGWGVGWSLRFGFLALGIGAALYAGAHPVGLVIGLSMIMPAAVIEAWRSRPPVVADAPALPPDDPCWDRWDPWLARERDPDDDEDAW
jgi:hypothetical protein